MCSVTWNSAVRLVFCGSREVGSACSPTLRMPPRFGWPAGAAAGAGAVVGVAGAVVGAAGVVGWAATAGTVVGCAAGAGAVVGFAAAAAVGCAGAGALVGAAGVAAGPHADSSSAPAINRYGNGRG